MAKAAAAGGPLLPEDLVVWEILTRVPAKTLLRCRAVCRSWRCRLTTDAKFLLAHHRRQPSLPLVTEGDRDTEERRFDALDYRTGERRPVFRTTGRIPAGMADRVKASCDGLLILSANRCLQICNPATRQRAPLTLLHGAEYICALYPHRPSGSYRVLCCFNRAEDGHAVYHVYTIGSGELRCVGELPRPWVSRNMAILMRIIMFEDRPLVVAGSKIYWRPVTPMFLVGGNGKYNNMLVFDTMAESFQQLLSPVEGPSIELFQMKSDTLGLYHRCGDTVDLWVLQDHSNGSWSMYHRINLGMLNLQPVVDPEGDVLVLSERAPYLLLISGANGSLLAQYKWSSSLHLSRHRFKESLVHHDFFSMEGNAGGLDEKPLFDGLSTVALVRKDNSKPCKKQRY